MTNVSSTLFWLSFIALFVYLLSAWKRMRANTSTELPIQFASICAVCMLIIAGRRARTSKRIAECRSLPKPLVVPLIVTAFCCVNYALDIVRFD